MSACRSCGDPVRWAIVKGSEKRMPLNVQPTQLGSVWLDPGGRAVVLAPAALARAKAKGERLWMPHHATCDMASRHRGIPRAQLSLEFE